VPRGSIAHLSARAARCAGVRRVRMRPDRSVVLWVGRASGFVDVKA
jgi:hypothetical protein